MTSPHDLGFVHRFEPATGGGATPTLLLLHGTGGDENDLLPLGRTLSPGSALLSPRGQVMEGSMPRFFRRLAEGVFDQDDLARRTDDLAAFVKRASSAYGFDAGNVVALGFSNGANIAASLLLTHPQTLHAAALLRAMVPFEPDPAPDLDGVRVLLAGGRADPIVPVANVTRLDEILRSCGAEVELAWADAGHGLTQPDVDRARDWFSRLR
jgi:phospholipase/carboxylesterase